MENVNISENKNGGETRTLMMDLPSTVELAKQVTKDSVKKKRRRGKSKRKMSKPYLKVPWQNKRRNENAKRNNRFKKIVLAKTHAPYNNNQFLMEIHKPEADDNFEILQTPSARTRDSSFSVDSDENCFYSMPDDGDEFLTKEFSSVYEDAQSERLTAMPKAELIQEYLLLEAKYESLLKRSERSKQRVEEDRLTTGTDKETNTTDEESMSTDRDTTGTSIELTETNQPTLHEIMQRVKEQEEQIRELKLANEKLRYENEQLHQHSSSADSESDSSSSSGSCSSSSSSYSPGPSQNCEDVGDDVMALHNNAISNGLDTGSVPKSPMQNGFHNGSSTPTGDDI